MKDGLDATHNPQLKAPAMSNESTNPSGAAMEGGGFYNRNSAMQAGGIAGLLPLLESAARNVKVGHEPVVIADYGASQGRNSMGPMRIAIEEIRARTAADRPVQVIHTDLPSNDFSALFAALDDDAGSYLTGLSNVFPSAIGRSYFQPIIAPGSVHLGWNTWSMHWMNGETIQAPDQVFADFSTDKRIKDAVGQRQAADWQRFLECRASELRPGGRLITAFVGKNSELSGWEWLSDAFWGAIVDLGKSGVLSREEQTRLTVPAAPRSIEAVRAPFEASGSFAGLKLEHASLVDVPDPFWQAYKASGDAVAFAQAHANTTRAWSGPTLLRCLGDRPDRAAVLDMIYDRLAARLAVAPQEHKPFLAAAVLVKD
jgi:SAM dependent carboxyl methyltransferase